MPDTILIVEDDPSIARLLEVYLSERGYHVLRAMRGHEALHICRERIPNLVVLDVRLPDISGYDVGKAMRADPRTQHIPIIVLTAFSELQNKIIAHDEVKAEYFLGKPFDIQEVYSVIRNQLNNRRRTSHYHPVTNLPTAEIVNNQLRSLLSSQGWTFALMRINGFETFTQFYGVVVGEDVLKFTALLLCDSVKQHGEPTDFIGQMVVGPYFVLVSAPARIEAISQDVVARFDKDIQIHYDYRDRKQGRLEMADAQGTLHEFPLMSLSIAVLTSDDGPFRDIRELSEAAETILQRASNMQRQSVVVRSNNAP